MTQHTPEPWSTHLPVNPKSREELLDVAIAAQVGSTLKVIAEAFGQVAQTVFTPATANADRIVSCVNACEGINPEAVPELLAACKRGQELIRHLCMGPLDAAAQYGPDYEPPTSDDIVAEIRLIQAAIAKAEEGT